MKTYRIFVTYVRNGMPTNRTVMLVVDSIFSKEETINMVIDKYLETFKDILSLSITAEEVILCH